MKEEKIIFMNEIREEAQEFYKNYNSTIDEELFSSMLEMYYYNVPKESTSSMYLRKIENQLLGFKALDFDYYAKDVFRKSIFSSSKEKFMLILRKSICY